MESLVCLGFLSVRRLLPFCRWFCPNFDMATSNEVELQVEELMVSSSLDALCHVAQKIDLNKAY